MYIIEYATASEAEEAVKMNGMVVGDRPLTVQNGMMYQATLSSMAAMSAPTAGGAAPAGALGGAMAGLLSGGGLGAAALLGGTTGLPAGDALLAMQQMQQMQELQRIQVGAIGK